MRQFEIGKFALHHCLPISYGSSDANRQENPGTSMKRTLASKGNGAISIGPSIGMATWLTPCGVEKRDMEAAKRFDLRKPSSWLVTRRSE